MFQHSVKVPRHYKVAANILRRVSVEGASFKTLLYDQKLRHYRVDMLYSLLSETIKHSNELNEIFENTKLFEKEPGLDPYLAKILTTEFLYGKKELPGDSKPVKTILSYSKQFEQYLPLNQDSADKKVKTRRPRYVRVNTNFLSTEDAIQSFKNEGYQFIPCPSSSYDDYLALLGSLTEWDFTQDFHVKTVLVFATGTTFHNNELCLEKKILLQDKATTLPVHLLAPPPDSVVLDMCAAPGMKTSQIVSYMKNTGKVYAVERDSKRYNILCEMLKNTGCNNVDAIHRDALEIGRGDMNDVEYILVDPSCSGSGMEHSLYDYHENKERLQSLTSFQEKLLKHAMNAFPNAKRIVYSTCSINPEENERVVLNVVKASRTKWNIVDARELLGGQWQNHGSGMYGSLGVKCLYARPDSDLTIGFFLAVLDRKERDPENIAKIENDKKRKMKTKIAISQQDEEDQVVPENTEDTENCSVIPNLGCDNVKKSKKKKRVRTEEFLEDPENASIPNPGSDICAKKPKKKKRDENKESLTTVDSGNVHGSETAVRNPAIESDTETFERKPNKRKKVKETEDVTVEEVDVTVVKKSKKKKHKKDRSAPEDVAPETQIESETKKDNKTVDTFTEMAITEPLEEMSALPGKEKRKKKKKD